MSSSPARIAERVTRPPAHAAEPVGHINKTVPFSVVDGPGSRYVLFLQGCNFNCIACHNPYTINACDDCGVCVELCPEDVLAITSDLSVTLERSGCTECDICIDVCPRDATPLAYWMTVEQVLDEVRSALPFIRGITVSGGEATLQIDFLMELFHAVRTDHELAGLSILVDSNGAAPAATWDRLAPVIDGVMLDVKALDPTVHELLTARPNDQVLASADHLMDLDRLAEVRYLVMPGYNDDEATVDAFIAWTARHAAGVPVRIMAYRHHGVRTEGLHVPPADPDVVARIADRCAEAGIEAVAV